MTRLSLLPLPFAAGLAVVAPGCAETTAARAAIGDATVDAPIAPGDARSVDGGDCAPRSELPSGPACAALAELAAPANAVPAAAPGVAAYVLVALRAQADRERPPCAAEPWQDGAEAVARFTAPSAGRWRFTARGEHLGAVRGCAAGGACAAFGAYHGEHVSAALSVNAQRGEDGGGHAERFACAPLAHDRVASARAIVDRATGRGYDFGVVRTPPGGAVRAAAPFLMVDWQRADGSRALGGPAYDALALDGAAFTLGPVTVSAESTRAHLWLANVRPMEQAVAEGITVEVRPWSPRAESQPCERADVLARCAAGLDCQSAGDGGTRVRPAALTVTTLRAWRTSGSTSGSASLRLRLEGRGLGEAVAAAAARAARRRAPRTSCRRSSSRPRASGTSSRAPGSTRSTCAARARGRPPTRAAWSRRRRCASRSSSRRASASPSPRWAPRS
jgi:hypothetical protein